MVKKLENKGITLIALVLTVIVILILTGTGMSMLIGENGIIKNTIKAKNKATIANELEMINMATLEALTENNGAITKEILIKKLESYFGKNIELFGDGPWKYLGENGAYILKEDGSVEKGWICLYDENKVPKKVTTGYITMNIGDYINYDAGTDSTYTSSKGTNQKEKTQIYYVTGPNEESEATWICAEAEEYQKLLDNNQIEKGNGVDNQTFFASDAKYVKWKVLGADEESGELLIISSDVLKEENGAMKKLYLKGITGFLYGSDEIDKICSIYGKGKGATGGRGIKYEDVLKALGLEKTFDTMEYTYNWTNKSLESHSPSYDGGESYLKYYHVKRDDTTLKAGTLGIFNFYNAETKKWETSKQELKNFDEQKTIGKIERKMIRYIIGEREKNALGYDVLFKTNEEKEIDEKSRYWINTSYVNANSGYINWGIHYVYKSGYIGSGNLYDSFGNMGTPGLGIRPIVSLDKNVQLKLNSKTENTYDIE